MRRFAWREFAAGFWEGALEVFALSLLVILFTAALAGVTLGALL